MLTVSAAEPGLIGTMIKLVGGVQIEVVGEPSDALVDATLALRPTIYSYFQGK